MYRLLLVAILSLTFLGCSSDSSSSNSTVKYLSIVKAPSNDPVSIFENISLLFSDNLNTSTVTDSSAYIKDSDGNHIGLTLEVGNPDSKVLFTPYQYFSPSTSYTLVITTDVQNLEGQSLSSEYNYSFTTKAEESDGKELSFVSIKPMNESSGVNPLTDISIEFTKHISPEAQYENTPLIKVTDSYGSEVEGSLEIFNTVATFKPDEALEEYMSYRVELVGEVSDMFGSSYTTEQEWNFSTSTKSEINYGYKSLGSLDLNKAASLVRHTTLATLVDSKYVQFEAVIVVAQDVLEFLRFNVDADGYPSLTKVFSYKMPSQINSIDMAGILMAVGTMSNGVYLYTGIDIDNKSIMELVHKLPSSSVYGVAFNSDKEKLYAVGPDIGLNIFSTNDTQDELYQTSVDIDGTALKVVVNSDTDEVYVADYDSGVRIYDENGSNASLVETNSSVRGVYTFSDYYGFAGVHATSSIGRVGEIINHSYGGYIDMVSSAIDISQYSDKEGQVYNYMSNGSKGLLVYDTMGYLIGHISTGGEVVSSVGVDNYLVTLDSDGKLNIFNAVSDTSVIDFTSLPLNGGAIVSGGVVKIKFDEVLDLNTIIATDFSYDDGNKTVSFTMAKSIVDSNSTEIVLTPDEEPDCEECSVVISSNIKDIIGNIISPDQSILFSSGA